jgi:pyruvate dehydrogenase complex dehydrogenase (E1) component
MVDDWWPLLSAFERKVLWLASWTIHHANHLRDNVDGLKVGGHQASSASVAAIMTALYFHTLRPADRVAVKPHAAPIYHAIQYLLGRQTREKLEGFRGYKGAQSYPSRTKDSDDVDFSTGSVGLGVAQTLFSSLVQDYVRAHGWGLEEEASERNWLRDETGGSVYLRLSTRPIEQISRTMTPRCARRSSTAPIGCASLGPIARWLWLTPARSRPRRSRPSA